jgi:2-(1,2-epoxy-1,2-dihydrophenyl)acetyl-CoA isomerase
MTPMYVDVLARGAADERELVTVDRRGDRAVVTLRDPDKRNVLSAGLVAQLKEALGELAADPEVRTVVLTGEDPGFSAGGDLEMMRVAIGSLHDPQASEGAADIWRWIRLEFGAIVRLIARTDKAFIAALNGPAAGVGLAFALTCDLAVASERAILVPAFGRLGLIPEVGTSWALTRRLGYQGAFAFYAAGRHLDAQEAQRAGLVQEVVPHEELAAAVDAWCDRIAALPPHALAMAKPLLRAAADLPWDQSLTVEEFAEPTCFTTRAFADGVEAVAAATARRARA